MKVTFLCPADREDQFYGPMIRMMEATARRLGIEFEVVSCGQDHTVLKEKGTELCDRAEAPEYLVLVNENEVGATLLPYAAQRGIRTFVFIQGFTSADSFTLGRPREKYPTWLGQLLPDDREAGIQLAELLIERARREGLVASDGRIHMLGVSGPFTAASIFRLNGLRSVISKQEDVVLKEIAPAGWDEERAFSVTLSMLERYPEVGAIWAASDSMALGAARAVREQADDRILVGGVDWLPGIPERIRRGELAVSMGGHFLDGAWALLLLFDYHHGFDFPRLEMTSKLAALTEETVDRYSHLLAHRSLENLDLSKLSRHLNPTAGAFDLSVDSVI